MTTGRTLRPMTDAERHAIAAGDRVYNITLSLWAVVTHAYTDADGGRKGWVRWVRNDGATERQPSGVYSFSAQSWYMYR